MNNKDSFANETRYAKSLLAGIPDETIRRRAENTLMWYINKAKRSRIAFYVLSIVSIIASTAIPVINTFGAGSKGGFSAKDTIISLVAALGGIAASACTLFNFKEAWNRNRRYAERFKQECFFYQTRCENYEDKLDGEADKEFIRKMEHLAVEENKTWSEVNQKNHPQG